MHQGRLGPRVLIRRIGVVTLLPEMFDALDFGVLGRAKQNSIFDFLLSNPRDFADGVHRQVDDRPYGGGPGMVMSYKPLVEALEDLKRRMLMMPKVIYASPQGKKVNHDYLKRFNQSTESVIFVAGRYEGVDERFLLGHVDEEWSIGDFVLSGGELAIMTFIDSLARFLPGCVGHQASVEQDSFASGLLDHPHYTRPEVVDGMRVPRVLLEGNHQAIKSWRYEQALKATVVKRPDLLLDRIMTEDEKKLVEQLQSEL